MPYFCREASLTYWGKQKYRENTHFGGINREEDFADLHVTRLAGDGWAAIYPSLRSKSDRVAYNA